MDGIQALRGVLVVGCTNRPISDLDPAMVRPGRLERSLHVRTPTANDRRAIVHVLARRTRVHEAVTLDAIAEMTEGFTGADLRALFRCVYFLSPSAHERSSLHSLAYSLMR